MNRPAAKPQPELEVAGLEVWNALQAFNARKPVEVVTEKHGDVWVMRPAPPHLIRQVRASDLAANALRSEPTPLGRRVAVFACALSAFVMLYCIGQFLRVVL